MRQLQITAITFGVLFLFSAGADAQACSAAGSIISVKNTTMGIYEYVTFRIKKPLNSGSGHSVSTVTGPFTEDPSGNPVTITGPKYKRIRFNGVFWWCTTAEIFSLPKIAIKDIKRIEKFEGYVAYVVGYRNASIYLSTTTSNVGSIKQVVMKFKK